MRFIWTKSPTERDLIGSRPLSMPETWRSVANFRIPLGSALPPDWAPLTPPTVVLRPTAAIATATTAMEARRSRPPRPFRERISLFPLWARRHPPLGRASAVGGNIPTLTPREAIGTQRGTWLRSSRRRWQVGAPGAPRSRWVPGSGGGALGGVLGRRRASG